MKSHLCDIRMKNKEEFFAQTGAYSSYVTAWAKSSDAVIRQIAH